MPCALAPHPAGTSTHHPRKWCEPMGGDAAPSRPCRLGRWSSNSEAQTPRDFCLGQRWRPKPSHSRPSEFFQQPVPLCRVVHHPRSDRFGGYTPKKTYVWTPPKQTKPTCWTDSRISSENTICRCRPLEKRWRRAGQRWRRFNLWSAVSFWRFWSLYGVFPRSCRRIFQAEFWDTPSFLANFRVEFTLVVLFRWIIPLARWIFLRLLAVFSLFRFS